MGLENYTVTKIKKIMMQISCLMDKMTIYSILYLQTEKASPEKIFQISVYQLSVDLVK